MNNLKLRGQIFTDLTNKCLSISLFEKFHVSSKILIAESEKVTIKPQFNLILSILLKYAKSRMILHYKHAPANLFFSLQNFKNAIKNIYEQKKHTH